MRINSDSELRAERHANAVRAAHDAEAIAEKAARRAAESASRIRAAKAVRK